MPLKRYSYRADLSESQRRDAVRLFGCVRVVWNDALRMSEDAYAATGRKPSRGDLSRALTIAKTTEARAWLADVSSVPLQQSLADLDKAYRAFFDSVTGKRKGTKVRPPRFKKRGHRQSARFTRAAGFKVTTTTHGVGFVTLPKIGRVRFRLSRDLPSNPTSVTLIQTPDARFHVSFVVDEPSEDRRPVVSTADDTRPSVGIDVGLTSLAAITRSDGTRTKLDNPRWTRTRSVKIARAQRAYARKQKGSKNQDKARIKVAVHHRKATDARHDHYRKLAHELVRENQAVAFETLNLRGLGQTRLARSLHDAAWGTLFRYTAEAASEYGTDVIHIGRFEPTTQTCSVCGAPGGKKPLHVRVWTCAECGTELDRDYNAAVNIMVAAGLALAEPRETLNACGGSVRRRLAVADPVKQEPTERTASSDAAA